MIEIVSKPLERRPPVFQQQLRANLSIGLREGVDDLHARPASSFGPRHLTTKAFEPSLLFAGRRQADTSFYNVLKGSVDKRDHHIIDGYPRDPDNQVCVGVQHAVLRVSVAAGPDSGVESHGPRRLSILEDVTRLHLLELDLDEAREERPVIRVNQDDYLP